MGMSEYFSIAHRLGVEILVFCTNILGHVLHYLELKVRPPAIGTSKWSLKVFD